MAVSGLLPCSSETEASSDSHDVISRNKGLDVVLGDITSNRLRSFVFLRIWPSLCVLTTLLASSPSRRRVSSFCSDLYDHTMELSTEWTDVEGIGWMMYDGPTTYLLLRGWFR